MGDQDAEFDSLHWFESVSEHCKAKVEELRKLERKKGKSNEENLQSFHLTSKRIHVVQKEYELLYFGFTGARIFFRESQSDLKEEEEEQEEKHGSAPAANNTAPAAPA